MAGLDKMKESLSVKKQKLKEKEQIIKAQEKRSRQKRLSELGGLAYKAEIDKLDENILLGAFLEIAERSSDQKSIKTWLEKSKQIAMNKQSNRLLISFKNPPSFEIKDKLKQLNFRWNSFRGEYYGYGEENMIAEILNGLDFTIEVVH